MIGDPQVRTTQQSIANHLSHYYQALDNHREVRVSELIPTYQQFSPSLHSKLDSADIDMSVLSYCLSRLPEVIFYSRELIMYQTIDQLEALGYALDTWKPILAPSRRRRSYYHPDLHLIASQVTSDSDIDDLVNNLIAFQIEWRKIGQQYHSLPGATTARLQSLLGNNWIDKLKTSLNWDDLLLTLAGRDPNLYHQSAIDWWQDTKTKSLIVGLSSAPIYFVSSNMHSLVNIIGGYANQHQDAILSHIGTTYPDLFEEWLRIKSGQNILRVMDFLYYISSRFYADNPIEFTKKLEYERGLGISQVTTTSPISCNAQIIPVNSLSKTHFLDPYIKVTQPQKLANSTAYIINIEYPLGMTAYYLLHHLMESISSLKGVYVVGKAAILNGQIGDIQIPQTVYDERPNVLYNFNNHFNSLAPSNFRGSVLPNLKSVSVYGTFLENEPQLQHYSQEGFNAIEMESGPYLAAISEHLSPDRHLPQNETVNLTSPPFDLGIINYASDNPISQNLGEGEMKLRGIEPTYLALLSTLQRIVDLESDPK